MLNTTDSTLDAGYICLDPNPHANNASFNSTESHPLISISLPSLPDKMSLPDIMVRIYVSVCAFGLLGNTLALILMFQQRHKMMKKRHGQSVDNSSGCKSDLWCFIVLSLSDMMFCVMLIPQWNTSTNVNIHTTKSLMFYYERFEGALLNTFVLSSTWLTVSMTVNRYLHLSHPIWALRYLGRHCLTTAIILSVVFSVLFNIPRYWAKEVHQFTCISPENLYIVMDPETSPMWETGYQWSYFVLGIMVPLCSLVYSNARIIHAMFKSVAIEQTRNKEKNIITRTLIIVVFFYVILVSPTELIKFFKPMESSQSYLFAVSIANLLQAINFSYNFLPYLFLDKSVRRNIFRVFCGCSNHSREIAPNSMTGNFAIQVKFNNGKEQQKRRPLLRYNTPDNGTIETTGFTVKAEPHISQTLNVHGLLDE